MIRMRRKDTVTFRCSDHRGDLSSSYNINTMNEARKSAVYFILFLDSIAHVQ